MNGATAAKRTKSYESGLSVRLKDPAYAMAYLRAAIEEGSAVFHLALRDVAIYFIHGGESVKWPA